MEEKTLLPPNNKSAVDGEIVMLDKDFAMVLVLVLVEFVVVVVVPVSEAPQPPINHTNIIRANKPAFFDICSFKAIN